MSNTRYLGLVIGGPADGQRIVYDSPKLVVEETPPSPPLLLEPHQTINLVEHTRHTYHWTDAGPIGLWLLPGWTLAEAIKHMGNTIGVAALADRYEQIIARRKDDERHGR